MKISFVRVEYILYSDGQINKGLAANHVTVYIQEVSDIHRKVY